MKRVGYEYQGSGYDPGAVGHELQGCDAAPNLTLVMPYYENSGMLALQYAGWQGWPESIRKRLRVVLVDDGSQKAPAGAVARPADIPSLSIFRVLEDRPWHQHAARNLGADRAEDGWLLLTDMDHVLMAEAGAMLLERLYRLDSDTVYMLDRVEADTGKPTLNINGLPKPHPNSFLLMRELFWRIGGYDEDFCGIYGTDRLFRDRAFRVGKPGHLNIPLVRYWRDIVPDASTTTLPRKEGRMPGAKEAVLKAKAVRGEADAVKVLQFKWEQVL